MPIKDYDGLYDISSFGKVRRGGGLLKLTLEGRSGYPYVSLCKNSKVSKCYVHRLVAIAFVRNPDNKPLVNHIDGIKTNNRIENLEWCTYSENNQHAITTGLNPLSNRAKGSRNGFSKLTEDDVKSIRKISNKSYREIAVQFSVSKSTITGIKNNKIWKHI